MGVTGSGFGNYGNVVAIRDAKGFLHVYAHLSAIVVKVGQTVERGQMVGRQGTTGLSTGEHLHYEVRKACSPSFGYTPTEAGVVEPTAYLQAFAGVVAQTKYNPEIIKERIVAVNGKLQYIDLNKAGAYATKATDVRFMKLEKNKFSMKLVTRKDGKVSDLVKEFKADYGFNFPFFDSASKLPIGAVWDGNKYINGAFGKTLKWKEFSSRSGQLFISDLTEMSDSDFVVQGSPLVVSNGRASWDYYNKLEETAQDIGKDAKGNLVRCKRTFVGIDKNGDFLLAISDGRTSSDQGLTIEEMSLYMLDKGAVMALNGDGGGSTILADKTGGLNQSQNVGKNERAVHHAMLIYLL
jgi:hypothetical protein